MHENLPCNSFLIALIAALAAWSPIAVAQSRLQADQLRTYNAQVLTLESTTPAVRDAATDVTAAKLLASRARTMQTLIIQDPAQALALAFPEDVLADLAEAFPGQRGYLEQRGSWQGELEYVIEDDASMTSHRKVFRLHRDGEVLEVHFAGAVPPGLGSGRKVAIEGVRFGKDVAAGELQILDSATDGGEITPDGIGAAYPAKCSSSGPQSIVAVLVNLPSYKLHSAVTAEFVRGVLLGNNYSTVKSTPDWSVDDFWTQGSDGQTYLDPANTTVVGPIELASNFNTNSSGASYCDNYALRNTVMQQLDGSVDFKRYSRIQIIMPGNGACSWAGTANVGCTMLSTPGDGTFTASVSWYRAETMTSRDSAVQLTTHELGHNLGLLHAASRDFGAEALGAPGSYGTVAEYGDRFSTMGTWNLGFYAAPHAANQLSWLKATNVQTVTTAGTYTIQNYEGRPAGVKALKVRRGAATDQWLWVESRQNTGRYSSQLSPSVFGGALIHYDDPLVGGYSHLLDFTPGTAEFTDAALAAGQTWSDPYSNLSLTVSAVGPGGLTLAVNYGAPVCTRANPTVTLTPSVVSADYGTPVALTMTVKSGDSAACAAETFNLAATLPAGWSGTLAATSLEIGPGQQDSAALTATIPDPYALGTYTVSTTASGVAGKKAGSASASTTVTEPPLVCARSAPSIAVLPKTVTTESGTSVALAVTVKNTSSAACAAERFSFTLSKPSSWARTWSSTSLVLEPGAEEQATLQIGVPAGYAPSTRTLTLRASSGTSGLSRSTTASVTVVAPPPACVAKAPSISISPSSVEAKAGDSPEFLLTVTNNSSATCAAETVGLGVVAPTGWSKVLGQSAFSLAPGQQATTSLIVGVPAGVASGPRTVTASASSAATALSDSTTATVTVAPPACISAAPSITLSPAALSGLAGSVGSSTVTVRNNSSASCASETFNLTASGPAGWTRALAPSSLTLAPGAQATATLNVAVPAAQAPGSFSVVAMATSAVSAQAASGTLAYTVAAPTVRKLSVNLVGQGTVAVSPVPSLGGGVQLCRFACSVDYADAYAGAEATLTIMVNDPSTFAGWSGACSGTSLTCKLTMNADRSVTANFKLPGS